MTIKRCYPVLVGASVGENQLSNPSDLPPSGTVNGIEMTNNGDGTITANGTATASVAYQLAGIFKAVVGHKYYLRGCPTGGSNSTYSMNTSGGVDVGNGIIKVYNAESQYIWIAIQPGVTVNNITYRPNFIDLTAYFGSTIADYIYSLEQATAGAGIAKLRSWGFLKGYQAYNVGAIESVEVTGKKVVGFNQWDEEWEVGGLNGKTGADWATTDRIRSKNYVSVIPNMKYFITSPANVNVMFYNADKAFISALYFHPADNLPFTTPTDCYYIRFAEQATYGTTYNNDICINLSSSRNGEYEAYTEQIYDYGNDTLNGIFKLDASNRLYAYGDRKTSDGVITRNMKLVDLGTLEWINAGGLKLFYTTSIASLIRKAASPSEVFSWGIDSKGLTKLSYNTIDTETPYSICVSISGNLLATLDTETAYTDATAFKTAMSGVMLAFELATPTTEQSTPFTSPQVCYPDGTEEFVTENNVPVGHETRYQL